MTSPAAPSVPPGPVRRWVLGARPRTLPAAVVPVVVGTAAGWWATRVTAVRTGYSPSSPSLPFRPLGALHEPVWWRAAAALVVALAVQIGTNYANDYSDGVRGTDERRVGPVRLVASGLATPAAVRAAALAAFGVAGVVGLLLAAATSWWVLVVGAACLAAGWLYTGGPRPYGYLGLGEVFVFVFFGLVATLGTVYVLVGALDAAAWVAAVTVGLLATALLEANNLRDIEGDRVAGKRTLAVRLGRRRAGFLYVGMLGGAAAAVVALAAGWVPWAALALAVTPLAVAPARLALGRGEGPALLPVLGATGRLQMATGGLLGLGFALAGWIR